MVFITLVVIIVIIEFYILQDSWGYVMKKFIIIVGCLLLFIILGLMIININNSEKSATVGERNYVATKDDYDDAAKVVERFIKAQNKKDMKLVSSCVLDCKESDGQLLYPIEKRLDNIIKIKYLSYSITDSKYKPAMFTMKNNSKVIYQSGLVILVDYDVDFKKDNQPESEGINKDYYTLVKDENGKFKIVPGNI